MKNKTQYTSLRRTIFRYILLAIIGSAIITYVFFTLFGTIASTIIIRIIRYATGTNLSTAANAFDHLLYTNNNMYYIVILVYSIILFISFYFVFTKIATYFDEITDTIDDLVDLQDSRITLPEELSFIERKLNDCKDLLIRRDQDAKLAEQKKNDLVMYLAHDIKTPLTSIIGYLELLHEIPEMPIEQRAKYTDITLEKANRLETLINEFFEITRFNLSTIILHKGTINLTFMLQQMADEFYPMLQQKNNTIIVDTPEIVSTFGDSDKLSRVFNNIIKNAISYSYENTPIAIALTHDDTIVKITISNFGDQIPEHDCKTIFEKFYRLDSSRSSASGGSGLGLAIAKEIVEAHGGNIQVESTKELTTFSVILPKE